MILEDVSRKFDIVIESVDALNRKVERHREEANERFEQVEAASGSPMSIFGSGLIMSKSG